MRSIVILLIAIWLVSIDAKAQYDESLKGVPLKDRIWLGGGLGASFSGQLIYIEISPLAGYMLTRRWTAGLGFSYSYYEDKRFITPFTSRAIGIRPFTRYNVFDFLFVHSEYEHLWLKSNDLPNATASRLLLGGGLYTGTGRASFFIMILYDVIDSPPFGYIYPNPVIRMGVGVGL